MPPRKRPSFARRHTVTIDVRNAALDRGSWEAYWGGPAGGKAAWEALGAGWETGHSPLRTNLSTWPAPFWAYTPDVPRELRTLADLYAGTPALWVRAFRWLLGAGRSHVRPGEAAILDERLPELERDAEDTEPDDEADEPDPDEDAAPWRR